MIPQKDWPVHESHCCPIHGCKYGDEDCPVTNRLTPNYNQHCEDCENEGSLMYQKKPLGDPDTPLSKRKLVEFLKASHVIVEGANDRMALYGAGRNILAELALVGIAVGDFEFEEKQ
jgi:hypothetical protein